MNAIPPPAAPFVTEEGADTAAHHPCPYNTDQAKQLSAGAVVIVEDCWLCGDPVNPLWDYPAAHRSCDQLRREAYSKIICECGCDKNQHDGAKSLGKCIQCGWKYCRRLKVKK